MSKKSKESSYILKVEKRPPTEGEEKKAQSKVRSTSIKSESSNPEVTHAQPELEAKNENKEGGF